MKFAPISVALAAVLAVGSISVPTFSVAQDGAQYQHYEDYCHHQKKKGQHTGAILGAIGGAIIGSNLAAHSGGRAGGAVLGAAAGAAVGSNIGRSAGAAKCDGDHAYWTEEQTYPYDDTTYYHAGGYYDDDWYRGHHCRWAQDYDGSYVRVCRGHHGYYYYSR
jgi:hypothetical protein